MSASTVQEVELPEGQTGYKCPFCNTVKTQLSEAQAHAQQCAASRSDILTDEQPHQNVDVLTEEA